MRLETLQIENFRGIQGMRIDFHRRLNVFVGENGIGKTTILNALGKTIDIARLNHVTGNELKDLESGCIINPHDIHMGSKNAHLKLKLLLRDQHINTAVGSKPEQLSSDLNSHFPEADVNLPHKMFSESRSTITGTYTPNENVKNLITGIDPIIGSIVKDTTQYGHAFAWISQREAFENSRLRKFIDSGKEFGKDSFEKDSVLQAVKKVITDITGFEGLFDDREKYGFTVRKNFESEEETLLFSQLSSGEQHLISFIATLAVYLAASFPDAEEPLSGEGVFIIDAIELHLHTSWQRKIIPRLLTSFPNCQFIITTHSPQILSHIKPESVFILKRSNQNVVHEKPEECYGMSVDRVVELVMDDVSRPEIVRNDLDNLFELIERKKIKLAKELIADLKKDMGTDPELMRAEMLIRRLEMNK